jgi:hypothetical protein
MHMGSIVHCSLIKCMLRRHRTYTRAALCTARSIDAYFKTLCTTLCCFLQPNQRTIATPPSRLLSAHASGSGRLPPRHRYSSSGPADDTAAASSAAAGAAAAKFYDNSNSSQAQNMYFGLGDTLDKELSRINLGSSAAAAAPGGGSSSSTAAMTAQQRLLAVGTAGAGGGAAAQAQQVEASDVSMLGTSMWLPSNGHTQL